MHSSPPVRAVARPVPIIVHPRRRSAPAPFPWQPLILVGVASFAAFLALLLGGGALFYGYYQTNTLILPGVRVGSVELGDMDFEQAAIILQKTWNLETRIAVTNGAQTQVVAPADIGLSLDVIETTRRSQAIGRGGLIEGLGQLLVSLNEGWQVAPVATLDLDAARRGLEALAPALGQPAQDAALRLEAGRLAAAPSQIGYTINIDQTLAVLLLDPQGVLENGLLQIVPMPVLPTVTDVSPALAQAQRLLDTPIRLEIYDAITNERIPINTPPEIVATWLRITPGQAGSQPQIVFNENQIAAYLNSLSSSLGAGRFLDIASASAQIAAAPQGQVVTLIARHTPTTYIVQAGDTFLKIGWKLGYPFWMIANANPSVDADSLSAGTKLIIPSPDDLLPLPIVPNKRIVISIDRQRMWVYQDGAQINEFVISTGINRSPTQPGIFQVRTHVLNAYASVWDLYMPHFMGIYEAWPGFMNGIHGLPTLSNGQRLWANVLGRPASYGCIILNLETAEWLYNWAEEGVVVEIQ